jgi:hypothetical protein
MVSTPYYVVSEALFLPEVKTLYSPGWPVKLPNLDPREGSRRDVVHRAYDLHNVGLNDWPPNG